MPIMSDKFYIVITSQALCSDGGPIRIEHYSDLEPCRTKGVAKRRGFKERGSDDFNIGVVSGNRLVDLLWMDESIGEDPETLRRIAEEIDL